MHDPSTSHRLDASTNGHDDSTKHRSRRVAHAGKQSFRFDQTAGETGSAPSVSQFADTCPAAHFA
jgi:hypothetical protein